LRDVGPELGSVLSADKQVHGCRLQLAIDDHGRVLPTACTSNDYSSACCEPTALGPRQTRTQAPPGAWRTTGRLWEFARVAFDGAAHRGRTGHPLDLPRTIHEAFHIARSGRPGPVVVDIPQNLSRADISYKPVTDVYLPGYQPTTEGNQKQIRLAAKAQEPIAQAAEARSASATRSVTCLASAALSTGLIGIARCVRASASVAGNETAVAYGAIAGWRWIGER
jgi:hypothetical protein